MEPITLRARRTWRGLAERFYTTSLYGLTLAGPSPRRLSRLPPAPWPGQPESGRAIIAGRVKCVGYGFDSVNPDWFAADAGDTALATLHSFAWLDDLAALGTPEARARARDLIAAWLRAPGSWRTKGWAPEVLAKRAISWITHARFISLGDDDPMATPILASLARQTRHLARTATAAPPGLGRIVAATGLIYTGLCGFGERVARRGTKLLEQEVAHQLLPDGGHVARSPEIHARTLANLVDVRAMLGLAGSSTPAWLGGAIAGMAPVLRLFRHGDGGLALFNRTEWLDPAFLDAVLTRADVPTGAPAYAPHAGYARLAAGTTVVLIDVGGPPPSPFDEGTHAGTLSFEMSCGRERLIVNCGSRAERDWQHAARATAAHSTIVIDETNSSEIIAGGGIGRRAKVGDTTVESADGNHWIAASHNGYQSNLGIVHRRRLYLAADGNDLRGEDMLIGGREKFIVRFHLHPDVRASLVQNAAAVLLRTPSGTAWRMQAANGTLSLTDSIYLAGPGAPRRSEQVLISGQVEANEIIVKWALRRIESK